MAKKISKEEIRVETSDDVRQRLEEAFNEKRAEFQEKFGPLALGDVEIGKAVTVQVKDFHPVVTSIFVRLPIEVMESPNDAIRRVRSIVEEELTDAVGDVINDGLSKYEENARKKRRS